MRAVFFRQGSPWPQVFPRLRLYRFGTLQSKPGRQGAWMPRLPSGPYESLVRVLFLVFCLVLGPFPALFHSLLVRARTQVVVASLESSGLNWFQQPGCPIQRKGFCRKVGRTTPYIEPTGGWSVPTPCLDWIGGQSQG